MERGGVIEQARLHYLIYGDLDASGGNVVLFPHMYSGRVTSLGHLVGPGRALDPTKLCIVVPGQLGGGESSSPSLSSAARREPFSCLTIGDDATAQRVLVSDILGVSRLALVAGYSMGALQAYEWAVRYPAAVARLAVIAGTARTTARTAAVLDQMVAELADSPRAQALRCHALRWSRLGVTDAAYEHESWREAGYESAEAFVRERFVDDFASCSIDDLLCQLGKWRTADVSRHAGGSLREALGRIRAETAVIAYGGDKLFPPAECAAEQVLIRQAHLHLIDTPWGHFGFAGLHRSDVDRLDQLLCELLEKETQPCA